MDEATIGILLIYLAITLFVGLIMVLGVNTSKRKHGFEISYAEAFVLILLWPFLPLFFLAYQMGIVIFGIVTWWQSRK